MNKKEKDKQEQFLYAFFLINPETEEKMEITKVEGNECGHDCLQITVEGISGACLHKIYTEEI